MISKIPPGTGKDAFIAKLVKFRIECGNPSYQELAALSKKLRVLYPSPPEATGRYVTLSVAAISETLAGKRKTMPAFNWVISFILCCQRWVYETRATGTDPGTATLGTWLKLWAAHASPPEPGASAGPAQPLAGSLPEAAGSHLCPAGITPEHQKFIAGHGPYGLVLLSQASTGSADALYRIAVLLATDPAWHEDAEAKLADIAAAMHGPSISLLDAHSGHLAPSEAAGHALRLAKAADAEGRRDEAAAFYQAAARGSAPAAVDKLANSPE